MRTFLSSFGTASLCLLAGTSLAADPDAVPGLGTSRIDESGIVTGELDRSLPDAPVRLAVIGDFGSNTPSQLAVTEMVRSWQPEAVLTVGDNNYLSPDPDTILDTTADGRPLNGWQMAVGHYFGEFIAKRQDGSFPELRSPTPRLFPTVGNHDREDFPGPNGPIHGYLEYFHRNPGGSPRLPMDRGAQHTPDISHYVVRLGPIDCFMLDSNPDPEFKEAEARRLDRQRQWFAAEVAASTARWKIACFHHSPYGSGSYGGHARMQWPEFSSLDAIFCGHDHLYERLVYHADGGDSGPLLFVTGHGGASLYRFRDTAPQSRVRQADVHGALQLRADSQGFAVEAWAVDPVTRDRRPIDAAVLGTVPAGDAVDDYWFEATSGATVEAHLSTAAPSATEPPPPLVIELWSPDGVPVAQGPSPLRHLVTTTGQWRVSVTAPTHGRFAYRLRLTTPDAETFPAWSSRHFPTAAAAKSGPTADPDRDGLDNLTEFALDLDPTKPDRGCPAVTVSPVDPDLFDIRVLLPPKPAPGVTLRLEEKFVPPGGGAVQWLERLVLSPWQPRRGIEAWEPVTDGSGRPALRWLRARGQEKKPAPPVFRWRASLIPAAP